MSLYQSDEVLFDYKIYRFGRSRQLFRGPKPDVARPFVSFIGAASTFGRFVHEPYPQLLGEELGIGALNLGTDGAGPGFFVSDPEIVRTASRAKVCVIQVMSARNLSNRMFSVRPRRNQRLHAVSDLLKGIYPDVDFGRFSFVRVMLATLMKEDPIRFRLVENEMRNAWMARMRSLLSMIETKKVLFWFSGRTPDARDPDPEDPEFIKYPSFIDREMVDAIRPGADGYVEVVSSEGLPADLTRDGEVVMFRPSGMPIEFNMKYPSREMHRQAAMALGPEIRRVMRG